MSEFSTLTIKIPLELKEKIRTSALDKQLSLSMEVCERLANSLDAESQQSERKGAKKANAKEEVDIAIDNQHIEEAEHPLSQKELKKLRQLLKNYGKKK